MNFRSTVLILVAAVIASGCAQVNRQAFNKEAHASLKSIAITKPQAQEEYETVIQAHPGANFGLIGGLIAVADMKSKTSRVNAVIEPKEIRLQDRFATKLSESLNKAGYDTQVVAVPEEVGKDNIVDYVKKHAGADAVLAIEVEGSYIAAGPTTDYFPFIRVNAKKVHALTGAILYEDNFTYGYTLQGLKTVHFSPDSSYRFASIDKLMEDPAKTRLALISGIDSIAEQIAMDLKKN